MKTLQCRTHGGTFKIGPKRGRDPVNCGDKWPQCTRYLDVPTANKVVTPMEDTPWIEAQVRLEEQSWLTAGKGRITDPNETLSFPNGSRMNGGRFRVVDLTAVRGDEMLIMVWVDGRLMQQDYQLWASDRPSANGKPANALTFDPDECTDRELVRALAGMKCTWWNVLGQKTEEAIIAPKSIKIEHAYNGLGDESPGDRIVKFIEHGGAGYRAFRVAALLKVG